MNYQLPSLPYPYNALEPYIDAMTMEIHHSKHHKAYVDNLNNALSEHPKLLKLPVTELLTKINTVPEGIRQVVTNNAGGHANHSFFWKVMIPVQKTSGPTGTLKEALEKHFGSLEAFKEQFTQKAVSLFGSGWVFLVKTKSGQIKLKRHSFQNSPLMQGSSPILGIDLWEHAYYLKYQNRKLDYIKAWWNVVNWKEAEKNFSSLQ